MDNRARVFVFAAVLLISTSVASAGVNSWTTVGPTGGQVQKVAYNTANPSILYMISVGGFSRSQDGGATWQTIRNDFQNSPADLAVDPSTPSRVYAVVPNPAALLVSTDSGATLTPVTSFPSTVTNPFQVQVSQDGATVCVTATLDVVCSADHGQTWTLRGSLGTDPTGRVNKLLMDPTDSNTLYASVTLSSAPQASGFFVTHDGGTTWQQASPIANSDSLPWDLAYSPGSPATIWAARYDGVWSSRDGGVSWSSAGFNGNAVLGRATTAIAVSPLNPAVLYVATPWGEVYASQNSGTAWSNITGNSYGGDLVFAVPHPTQSNTILVGGGNGLWATTDGGVTWSEKVDGLVATNIAKLSADRASDRIYAATPEGGVYSIVQGASVTTPVNNVALARLTSVPHSLQVNTLLAESGSPGPLFATTASGIAKSGDGGSSWSLLAGYTVTPKQVFSLASSAAAPQVILSGGIQGAYRSTDGGDSWAGANTGFPVGTGVSNLVVAASDATIAYASPYMDGSTPVSYGVYRSRDGGQTWSAANSGMTSSPILDIGVDPTNAQVVYASTDSSVLKSINGGDSWTALQPFGTGAGFGGNFGYLALDPAHPNTIYVASSWRVSRSIDGGATWETLLKTQASLQWIVNTVLVDPNRTSNLLVGTGAAGIQEITIAPNLTLKVAAPTSSVTVGTAATYTYTVTNAGPFAATGIQLKLQLPAAAQSITATANSGSCTVSGAGVSCTLGSMGNGVSTTVQLSATSMTAGDFQVAAAVQADQPDSDMTDNSISSDSTIVVATQTTPPQSSNTPPPASSSHGGGGTISIQWLLSLLLALGVRIIRGYHEASRPDGVDRKSDFGCCPVSR